jgi:hypothetical protein
VPWPDIDSANTKYRTEIIDFIWNGS